MDTNENSFKIKSRTFILLENIVKLGFRAITSEICESEFVISNEKKNNPNVARSDVAKQF